MTSAGMVVRLLLLLTVLGLLLFALYHWEIWSADELEQRVGAAGIWGPLLLILIHVIATLLLIPGTPLTLAGGALFGPLWGTLFNLAGSSLGALLAFLIARHLAAAEVRRRVGRRGRRVAAWAERGGWRVVAFTRLVPLFPFSFLNYAFGLTRIPTVHYLVATVVFVVPAVFAYTYLGYAGVEAIQDGEAAGRKVVLALLLLALVTLLPPLLRWQRFRRLWRR